MKTIKYISSFFKEIKLKYFFIAFIHWGVSFFSDRFFFAYENVRQSEIFYHKIIFFIILLFVWQSIGYIIDEYKNNEKLRQILKYSLIYFAVMMILLVLTWPGVWRGDEFSILSYVKTLKHNLWQGFFINELYIYSLMLLPFPTGIIIIQNIFISLIVGYIVYSVRNYFSWNKISFFIFIPFLLLPVLDNNLYPMRTTLYAYLWLLMVIKIIFFEKNKIQYKNFFIILSLALIISLIRSEGLFALFSMPLICLFYFHKYIKKWQKIIFIIAYFICVGIFVYVQHNILDRNNGKKYEIYSIISSMSYLYDKADPYMQKKIEPAINKILDLSDFKKGNKIQIHDKKIIKKFTLNEYKEFLKSFVELVLKYPNIFWFERYDEFVNSIHNINRTTTLFDHGSGYYEYDADIFELKLFKPINVSMRKNIISFIERRDVNDSNIQLTFFRIFYTPSYLLILLSIATLIFIFYGFYIIIPIDFMILFTTLFVVVLSPARLFIYYFYLYIISCVLFAVCLIMICSRKKYV